MAQSPAISNHAPFVAGWELVEVQCSAWEGWNQSPRSKIIIKKKEIPIDKWDVEEGQRAKQPGTIQSNPIAILVPMSKNQFGPPPINSILITVSSGATKKCLRYNQSRKQVQVCGDYVPCRRLCGVWSEKKRQEKKSCLLHTMESYNFPTSNTAWHRRTKLEIDIKFSVSRSQITQSESMSTMYETQCCMCVKFTWATTTRNKKEEETDAEREQSLYHSTPKGCPLYPVLLLAAQLTKVSAAVTLWDCRPKIC